MWVKLSSEKRRRLAYRWRDELLFPKSFSGVLSPQVGKKLDPDEWLLVGIDTETASEANGETLSLQYVSDESEIIFVYGTDRDETALEDLLDICIEDMIKVGKRKTLITAHNLRFEICSLFRAELEGLNPGTTEVHIKRERYDIRFTLTNPFFVDIRFRRGGEENRKRYQILIRDSLQFFQASLEEAGKAFSLPKLDKPKLLGKSLTSRRFRKNKELMEYAINDARIQHKLTQYIMREFVVNVGLSSIPMSGSNFAAKAFRAHITSEYGLDLPAWCEQMSLDAYSGGLNWWNGKRGIYEQATVIDMVSCYASIMCSLPELTTGKLQHVFSLESAIKQPHSVCRICCTVLEHNDGFYWLKKDGKTVLPGVHTLTLTGKELEVACKYNHITVHSVFGFYWKPDVDTQNELEDFLRKRYKIKGDKNRPKGERDAAKLSMNSLYGQFIHRKTLANTRTVEESTICDSGQPYIEDEGFDDIKRISEGGMLLSPYYAALITGIARATITDSALTSVRNEPSKILYISTDGYAIQGDWVHGRENEGKGMGKFEEKIVGPCVLLGERRYLIMKGDRYICANHGMQAPSTVQWNEPGTVRQWYMDVLTVQASGIPYRYQATRVHGPTSETPNRFEHVTKKVNATLQRYHVA